MKLGLDSPVILTARIYYQSRRSDLSSEMLMDLLQKVGMIKNDRQIVEQHLYGFVDSVKPRVEFSLEVKKDG
jgi:Holliday junction resolvase RusA-like endonuclease